MSALTVALQPSSFAPIKTPALIEKLFSVVAEGPIILKAVADSIKKKIADVCNKVSGDIETQFGSFFPDWKDRKKKPVVFAAENNDKLEVASGDGKNKDDVVSIRLFVPSELLP